MNRFTLSRPADAVLIESVAGSDGKVYKINPDFRVMLGCFRVLNDPCSTDIKKACYIAKHFFVENPPPNMGEAFVDFLSDGEEKSDDTPVMDFEIDAAAIYAGFKEQYQIDLLHENLHWYEFQALLSGLNETTEYRQRIKIRQMKPEDVAEKDRPTLRELQEKLSIAPRMTAEEKELQAELDRRLAAGEDPTEIIKKLQEV